MQYLGSFWVNLRHPNPEQISKTLRNLGMLKKISPLPRLPYCLQSCDGTQPVSLTYLLRARCIRAKGTCEEIALQRQLSFAETHCQDICTSHARKHQGYACTSCMSLHFTMRSSSCRQCDDSSLLSQCVPNSSSMNTYLWPQISCWNACAGHAAIHQIIRAGRHAPAFLGSPLPAAPQKGFQLHPPGTPRPTQYRGCKHMQCCQ